jgi:ubiquitin-protein ligase
VELKTVTQELKNDILVFPADVTVERWRVFINGPLNTPFENRWWTLLLIFPIQYPMLPPILRFVSVPYHPNVAIEGRVFFSKLEIGYEGSMKVSDILIGVRQLLQEPEIASAIRPDVAKQYNEERRAFERQARNGSLDPEFPAKEDWHEFPWRIYDNDAE